MELLIEHHYVQHVLQMPASQWPDPVNRAFHKINKKIYIPMQGRANSAPAESPLGIGVD
jgi:proline iminopeptidase